MRPPSAGSSGIGALLGALAAVTLGSACQQPDDRQRPGVLPPVGSHRHRRADGMVRDRCWRHRRRRRFRRRRSHPAPVQSPGSSCVGHDEVPGGCVEVPAPTTPGTATHVAGIVAAATNNGQGVAGVAPGARILGIKVLANVCSPDGGDADGDPQCEAQGRESDVAQGVRWAADRGAAVINLSLGNEAQAIIGPGDDFAAALDYAWGRGSIPVLVAGNDLLLPGSLVDVPAVIVAATTRRHPGGVLERRRQRALGGGRTSGGEADSGQHVRVGRHTGSCRPTTGRRTSRRPARRASRGTSMAAPHCRAPSPCSAAPGSVLRKPSTACSPPPTTWERPSATTLFGSGRISLAPRRRRAVGRRGGSGDPRGQPVDHNARTAAAPGATAVVSPGTIAPPAVPGTTATTTAVPPADTSQTSTPVDEDARCSRSAARRRRHARRCR